MKKISTKYLIDAILFIDICSIAVTGLLLAFVIPEGRAGRGSKYFLGLHRHEWGDIHLFLSLLLLSLVVLHLWFNWTWIVQSSRNYFGNNWKNALWFISAAWIFMIAIAYVAYVAIRISAVR